MKNIIEFMNKKGTIVIIRTIGYVYLIAIIINTIFFYGQYLYQTFLGSGLCGIICYSMISYKKPCKEGNGLVQKFFDKVDKIFDKVTPIR